MSTLNPQISVVSVGVKQIREVTIYPLSMADQFKMTDLIISVFSKFTTITSKKGIKDSELVAQVIPLIEANLQKMLSLVTDDGESIKFEELTNSQFAELVELIYDVNYEASLKKLQSLSQKIKKLMPGKMA